jgi:hypothetical protein
MGGCSYLDRTSKSFSSCDAVIEYLNKRWKDQFGCDYEKNDQEIYTRLAPLTKQAIDNARAVREKDWANTTDIVECNSATEVYQLVERLLPPPGSPRFARCDRST